jgi:hypothetical protein
MGHRSTGEEGRDTGFSQVLLHRILGAEQRCEDRGDYEQAQQDQGGDPCRGGEHPPADLPQTPAVKHRYLEIYFFVGGEGLCPS